MRRFRQWQHGEFVVVGCDTSAGMGDYCTAQFLSKTKLDVPQVYHSKLSVVDMTPIIHDELNLIYDQTGIKPVVAYERQNGGVFELERLARINREGKYKIFTMPTFGGVNNSEPTKIGWDTNSATRPKMLSDVKDAIDNRLIRIYDKRTIEEMFAFILTQTSTSVKAQAEKGAHDDLVMALAIAWQLYQSENPEYPSSNRMPPAYKPMDSIIDECSKTISGPRGSHSLINFRK